MNLTSKQDFITYILVEELIGKRMDLLINFRDGLDYFGLIKLINQEPDLWKEVFVTESGKPTHLQSDDLMSLVNVSLNQLLNT